MFISQSMSPLRLRFLKTAAGRPCSVLAPTTLLPVIYNGNSAPGAWTCNTSSGLRVSLFLSTRSFTTVQAWEAFCVMHSMRSLFHRQGGTVRFKSGDNQSEGHLAGKPPPYNPNQNALELFSNLFFYKNERQAEHAKEDREQVLKDMTVGEVHRKYVLDYPRGKRQGIYDFADLISARVISIEAFLDPSEEPVEDTLYRMNMIDLAGGRETSIYHNGFIKKLPTTDGVWEVHSKDIKHQDPPRRLLPLCFVLGPSGSGKTCFALKYLRNKALVPPDKKVVTIYINPGKTGIVFKENNALAAKELMKMIREGIARKSARKMPEKLDMHVCLVFDEAGSSYTKAWFESVERLKDLCNEASQLASSVTVVVVGTGLTGRELNSSTDAFVYRMKPWQASDLSMVLTSAKDKLRLVEQETIDTVANAIFAQPKLGALATNARAACFLARAVANLSSGYSRLSWELQLNEWTQTLVTQVVDCYISFNSINGLRTNERRRVAASVFCAIQNLKKGDTRLPILSELDEHEIPVAQSLIQYNVERGVGDSLQIVPGEDFAFTITPALAVVLYDMAGVYTAPFYGEGQSGKEVAALYAVRQSMIQCMERFVGNLIQGLHRMDCQDELDESLARIRLVRLQERLDSDSDNVVVPMMDGRTIMMNGDPLSSFADVIAPFQLIKVKHTNHADETCTVNLYKELKKCGLVNEKDSDTRLLRGLMAIWQDKIDMNALSIIRLQNAATESLPEKTENRDRQCSKAFPENVLSRVPHKDPTQYAVIQGKRATVMNSEACETKIKLPDWDGTTITFLLSTNAKRLKLDLGPSHSPVIITQADLDDDLQIKKVDKDSRQPSIWTAFVKDRLRDGVQIKFLFITT